MSASLEIPKVPRRMVLEPLLTDQEFEELCAANSDIALERTKEGAIVVNAPAGSGSSDGNAEIVYQLRAWWKQHRRGRVYDSSVGVFLPDGSALSPDAAYIAAEQASALTAEDLDHFLRFVPAFVIELLSSTDSLPKSHRKMETWMANGALLGWLIDPYARAVHVYEAKKQVRIESGDRIVGTGPLAGFALDLAEVWLSFKL
jgi:Uma2 family endonuclease